MEIITENETKVTLQRVVCPKKAVLDLLQEQQQQLYKISADTTRHHLSAKMILIYTYRFTKMLSSLITFDRFMLDLR